MRNTTTTTLSSRIFCASVDASVSNSRRGARVSGWNDVVVRTPRQFVINIGAMTPDD
jgi:hypothetical protein